MAGRAVQGLKPAALLWLLVATSCATVSRGTVREDDAFAALGDGASLYLRIDVASARPVLDAIAAQSPSVGNMKRVGEILDRTASAAVAVFPAGGPRRYFLAARGRYPTGRGAFSLALSPDWKKKENALGERYWRSTGGVSLAFNGQSALVSDGEPFSATPPPRPPRAYAAYGAGAVLSGWISEPSSAISGFLGEAGSQIRLPIEELVFAVLNQAGTDRFVLEARLVAASPERSRSLASILRLVSASLDDDALPPGGALIKTLLSSPPRTEGESVILRAEAMTAEEIALLCADVSIYFNQ